MGHKLNTTKDKLHTSICLYCVLFIFDKNYLLKFKSKAWLEILDMSQFYIVFKTTQKYYIL